MIGLSLSEKISRLLQVASKAPSTTLDAEMLDDLPAPVRRYLELAQIAGKKMPRTGYVMQSGLFRTAPKQKWLTMKAEQWFSLDPPGFVWRGSIETFPLVRISAVDALVDGHGGLEVKALSIFPIAKFSGPEADSAQFGRFLLELAWFPACWLSRYIKWRPVDGSSASVHIESTKGNAAAAVAHSEEFKASAVVHFGEDGFPMKMETTRYRALGRNLVLTPWIGRCADYEQVEGVAVPTNVSVSWVLDHGEFEYFRVKVTELKYDSLGA